VLRVCRALAIHVERLATIGEDSLTRAVVHRRADDRWVDMADAASGPLLGLARPLTAKERARAVADGVDVPLCILQSRLPAGRVFANVIEAHAESVPRSHPGEEFVYVLSGRARVSVGEEGYTLEEGEALTFFSAETHRYAPADPPPAVTRLLSVRIGG
jgi:quercetin dioxygenase-like cupin family protein